MDFDAGTLPEDAGLMLLREVNRWHDLNRRIDEPISDACDPILHDSSQAKILASRIIGNSAGHEDANAKN